jgi:succinate dehydrogenase / fumarate reductase cytochrome b subunit
MHRPETPAAFFWRRLHSFAGLVLIIYIISHLLTNSQAAFYLGQDGAGFIREVNWIRDLPYLPVIEFVVIFLPFLIHGLWGIKYLWTSKSNSWPTDGSVPALPQYARNQCYTWQRITSWILLVGVILHVAHMRYNEFPRSAQLGDHTYYVNNISMDPGLYTLGARLNFILLDENQIQHEKNSLAQSQLIQNPSTPQELLANQSYEQKKDWVAALEAKKIKPGQVIALSPDFGTAELLLVRDTFKSPLMMGLYTGFVIAAVFHAFNGLWTFLITWGLLLTERSQKYMKWASVFLMFLFGSLSVSAIWLTYLVNLRH